MAVPPTKFGIEIEAAYDHSKIPLDIVSYHRDNEGSNFESWSATTDSSLNARGCSNFDNANTVELVSCQLFSKDEVFRALDELKEKMPTLSEYLKFNASTGAHIHFSTFREKEKNMMFMSYYKRLREYTFNRVKAELPKVFPKFKKQYYRSHAPKQPDDVIDKGLRGEFSYTRLETGVEWRSFNLVGCSTWEDVYKMFEIAIDGILKIMEEYRDSEYREFLDIALQDEDVKLAEKHLADVFEILIT